MVIFNMEKRRTLSEKVTTLIMDDSILSGLREYKMSRREGTTINYVRKIFRKTNISTPMIRTRTCAHQGVRNIGFLEDFCMRRYG